MNLSNNKVERGISNNDSVSVLIVGAGLTGAISCYRIRSLLSNSESNQLLPSLRIEVIDMARGAGGRMSTTRQSFGKHEVKANTGAQYASCVSEETKRALKEVYENSKKNCDDDYKPGLTPKVINNPVERSLHFPLNSQNQQDLASAYTHFSIPEGTNNLVKQFLYAGKPDVVSFETRLNKLWKKRISDGKQLKKIVPEFDLRGRGQSNGNSNNLSNEYDIVILALPPKDAVKFFPSASNDNQSNRNPRKINKNHDPQSQADLHRRFNKSKFNNNSHISLSNRSSPELQALELSAETRNQLKKVQYIGRYSLALWFHPKDSHFAKTAFENFQNKQQQGINRVLDAVFLQGEKQQVLVVQSTVELWKQHSGVHAGGGRGGGKQAKGQSAGNSLNSIRGGGRQAVRDIITKALEEVANATIPQVAHAKLLNWRTSQVSVPLRGDKHMLSTEDGQVLLTGDWCTESSLEGCYNAAVAVSEAVLQQLALQVI